MKSVRFIINPISGTASKLNLAPLIDANINGEKLAYDIVYTEYAGHAEALAHKASKERINIVVAVGGDGTVNEVARGIIGSRTALAIIPCGSGNGLARHLMLPMDIKQAIGIINEAVIHRLDYGVIDGHPFLCTCGIGFDAFIAEKFANAGKRGIMSYVERIVFDGLSYQPEHYEFRIDDGEVIEQDAYLISCANASQYGNNAYIAPQASMRDGQLDFVVMEPFNLINAVSVNLEIMNKTINNNSRIQTFRGKKLVVKRQQEGYIHYDGEPVMAPAEIEIGLVEKGINVVVNSHADKKKRHPNFFQTALSEFFYNMDMLQKDIIETGKNIQKDIEVTRRLIRKDLAHSSKKIQKINQDILNMLTK